MARLGGRGRASLESRITWIWSTPRSGAALLLQMLCHPLRPDGAAALGFRPPPSRAMTAPRVLPIDELCFGSHLAPWPGDPVPLGERWMPGTVLNLNEGRPPYLLSRSSAGAWREPLREFLLTRIDHAIERAVDHVKAVEPDCLVVVKEATSTHAADRVAVLIPAAGMIVMVRDPRDVVASELQIPSSLDETPEPTRDERERLQAAERIARIWAMSVDVCSSAFEHRDAADGIRVRLEDLRSDPAHELARTRGVLGLSPDAAANAEAIEMSSIGGAPPDRELAEPDLLTATGAWREALTDAEVAAVEAIAGPRMSALGYETIFT